MGQKGNYGLSVQQNVDMNREKPILQNCTMRKNSQLDKKELVLTDDNGINKKKKWLWFH